MKKYTLFTVSAVLATLSDTQSIENSTKIHFDKDLLAGPDDSQKISATEPDLVNVNNDS